MQIFGRFRRPLTASLQSLHVDHAARFSQRRGADRRRRADAGGAACGAAGPLSARADGPARPARRLVRGRARVRPRGPAGRFRQACRSRSATTWSWSAAGSSGLSAAWFYRRQESAGAHPHPRQSRRLRRPRQAQRVHHRRAPHHRLRRQPVVPVAQFVLRPGGEGPAARARRRHQAVRDRVRPRSLPIARPLARRVLSARDVRPRRAGHRRCAAHECRRDGAPAQQRQAAARSSSPTFPFRRRARRSISRSIQRSAIRSPAALAEEKLALLKRTSYRDYLDQNLRLQRGGRQLSCKAARSASSGSAPTRCRRRMCAISAIRALRARSRRRRTPRGASPTSIISPTATRRSRACWCAR